MNRMFFNPFMMPPMGGRRGRRPQPQRKKSSKRANTVKTDGSIVKQYSVFSPVITKTPMQCKIGPDATMFNGTTLCQDALCFQFFQILSLTVKFIPTLNQYNAVGNVNLWISNDELAPAPTTDETILNSCSSAKGRILFTGLAKTWNVSLPSTEKKLYSTGRGEVTAGGIGVTFPYVLNAAIVGGGDTITNFGRLELLMTVKWHCPGAAPTATTMMANDGYHLSVDKDIYITYNDKMWSVDKYYVGSSAFSPEIFLIVTSANKYDTFLMGSVLEANKAAARTALIAIIESVSHTKMLCEPSTATVPTPPSGIAEGLKYTFDVETDTWVESATRLRIPYSHETVVYNVNPSVSNTSFDDYYRSLVMETQDVNVVNDPLNVNVVNDPLNVNVVNDPLNVNVTNDPLNVNVTNTPLDVNVTNDLLDVFVQNDPLPVDIVNQPIAVSEQANFGDVIFGLLEAVIPFVKTEEQNQILARLRQNLPTNQ